MCAFIKRNAVADPVRGLLEKRELGIEKSKNLKEGPFRGTTCRQHPELSGQHKKEKTPLKILNEKRDIIFRY